MGGFRPMGSAPSKLALKADKAQEDFANLTLVNSWAHAGGGTRVPGYMKDEFGFVHLSGAMNTGAQGSIAFTLPSGYRPEYALAFATAVNGTSTAVNKLSIATTGSTTVAAKADTVVYLDGIIFKAAT